ncbi:hypothetical protein [Sphingomonas bacterium]|uniref:hypothetical protein n=1 Tax=Sphingomonas bacterium TaxID=1895847 RepID=UPI001576BBAF|nr:hypothetical protein [Sphingomonas bacterium]
MLRVAIATALILMPGLAAAQTGSTPKRYRSVELRQGERCPVATSADEVVVCRTLDEPYRIPSGLRDEGAAQAAPNQSWVNRTAVADQAGRVAAGLPDTCSAVGTGGQSGCALATARAFSADKRARARADSSGAEPD